MALTGSGELKFSQMRDEFGGSGQVKFSDLYRGGSLVRANAGNNSSTNLAANVPTSGEIQVADFYSQAKGFRKTYTSGATNQDASSIFGDDYGVDYPKEIVINSGVELGATSTSQEALQIDSGLSGTMTITNNGTLTGAGGAAGSAGGDAFQADVACTLINNGTMRAGGGGGGSGGSGGSGGTGGQGRTSYTTYGSWINRTIPSGSGGSFQNLSPGVPNQFRNGVFNATQSNNYSYFYGTSGTNYSGSTRFYKAYNPPLTQTPVVSNVGSIRWNNANEDNDARGHSGGSYQVRSVGTGYNYYNGGSGGSGGSGGGGGVGQGYNQSAGSGSSGSSGSGGSAGGTNAGSGGTGGTGGAGGAGGSYGASGSSGSSGGTGNSGGNGNYTNGSGGSGGSSGSGGGAAGKYLRGSSNVTFTNNGTVQGGTA